MHKRRVNGRDRGKSHASWWGETKEQRLERTSEVPARHHQAAASIISDPYVLNFSLGCMPCKVSERSAVLKGALDTIPLPLPKLESYCWKVGRVHASLPFPEPALIPKGKVGQQHHNPRLLLHLRSLLTSVAGMVCLLPRGASKKNCSLAPVLTWSSFPVNEKGQRAMVLNCFLTDFESIIGA